MFVGGSGMYLLLTLITRSVGYSLGSAMGGLILAAGTDTGRLFPDDGAYTTAALVGVIAMAITAVAALALARRRPPAGYDRP